MAAIPTQARSKSLRACLLCSLIQLPVDFRKSGCPNCEEILQMRGNPDRIQSCTTTQFDGVIAIIDSSQSWVAQWQRVGTSIPLFSISLIHANHWSKLISTANKARGMYAVRVLGRIPEDVEMELERRGIKYRPRDQTDQD
ncbi:transcription elongation factor SPT4 [Panaeolus papilionaceus]|nr:transcription elongation factor SPT4 [Panaeolus papilionaceus]